MNADYFGKLQRLISGTLDPVEFRHLDHIGVTYEALARHEFFDAAYRMSSALRALAERAGVPEKFNATMTWAYMSLIAERMRTTEHRNAAEFIDRNPDIASSAALEPWYSQHRLKSDLARSTVLLPDGGLAMR